MLLNLGTALEAGGDREKWRPASLRGNGTAGRTKLCEVNDGSEMHWGRGKGPPRLGSNRKSPPEEAEVRGE